MNIIDAPKTDYALDTKKLMLLNKDDETGLFFSNVKVNSGVVSLQVDEDTSIQTKLSATDYRNAAKIYFNDQGIPVKVANKEKAAAASETKTVSSQARGTIVREAVSFAKY